MPKPSRVGRLRRRAEYDAVFRRPDVRMEERGFLLLERANQLDQPRLGLVVSRRAASLAVARNRLKRLIRESYRWGYVNLSSSDLVIVALPGSAAMSNDAVLCSLGRLWRRVGKRSSR